MIWVCLALFIVAVLIACLACYRIEAAVDRMLTAVRDNHAECVVMSTKAISTAHAAQVLRAAADRWDAVENVARQKKLARERWSPEGPTLPAIWMRDLADEMMGEKK